MFVFEESPNGSGDAEGRELPKLETELQPMLDWLSQNHPDFMRLNSFSEALSILRWVHGADVEPILVDMDGLPPEIVTPDRIVIGDGPRVQ